jgi:hypothetical protein
MTDKYVMANKFARNFYIERKNFLKDTFENIERLNLEENNTEKVKNIVSTLLTDVFYTILLGLDGEANIGEIQQTYKVYDEERRLISDCGELEAEAYEYFHENKYEAEGSKADFIATLTYRTTEQGGRKTPVLSGYRPQIKFNFQEMQTSGEQTFIERKMVFAGDTVKAEIKLLSPECFENKLNYEMKFEFREGETVIGTGKILHIINKRLKDNSFASPFDVEGITT